MKKEIHLQEAEMRFLVKVKTWEKMPNHNPSREITQAYLSSSSKRVVRIQKVDGQGYITIKGEKINGDGNSKWVFKIKEKEVDEILNHPKLFGEGAFPIVKIRHKINDPNLNWEGTPLAWEVDVYHEKNQGLVMAEMKYNQLGSKEEKCRFEAYIRANLPEWVGQELDMKKDEAFRRYLNYHLSEIPYSCWPPLWKKDMQEHQQL